MTTLQKRILNIVAIVVGIIVAALIVSGGCTYLIKAAYDYYFGP